MYLQIVGFLRLIFSVMCLMSTWYIIGRIFYKVKSYATQKLTYSDLEVLNVFSFNRVKRGAILDQTFSLLTTWKKKIVKP